MKTITTCALFSIILFFKTHAQFETDREISTSTWSMDDVTYGDLDNDGDLDVISVSSNRKIAVYRNIDGTNFERPEVISWGWTGYVPHIELADFNGDGYLDLIMTTDELNQLRWFPNDGAGNFPSSSVLVSVNQRVLDIEVADMDNDGDMDIVTSYYNATTNVRIVTWLEGDGSGNILNSHTISGVVRIGSLLRLVDLNGDGFKDLIVVDKESSPNRMYSYFNQGNGVFGGAFDVGVHTLIADVELTDLNGDNYPDLLVSSHYHLTPGIFRYMNNGLGGFTAPQRFYTSIAKDMALADIDGDSDMDLVFCNDNSTQWMQNNGAGIFSALTIIELGSYGVNRVVKAVDINSDGHKDLFGVDTYSNLYSFLNNGTGTFNGIRLSETMPEAFQVIAEDFDGDGLKDILFTGRNIGKVGMYKRLSDGSYGPMQILVTDFPFAQYLKLTDVNGDGLGDLIVASTTKIFWFQNMGNGTVGPGQNVYTISSGLMYEFEMEDLDNDGDFDIMIGSSGGFVWRENVNGNLNGPIHNTVAASGIPYYHVLKDMDNDGDPDFVYTHDTPYGIHKATNVGQGVFTNRSFIAGSTDLKGKIQVADMDNDGDPDIVGHSANAIKWFSNNGNHTYNTGTLVASGLTGAVEYIQVSDIDSDGDMDVIATFYNDWKIVYFENTGNGVFGAPIQISTLSNGTRTITMADMDNDGDDDLIWPYRGGIYGSQNTSMLFAGVSGTVFLDANENGVQDPGEMGAAQISILSNSFNGSTFTDHSGNYNAQFNGTTGTYQIFPSLPSGWHITTDSLTYTIVSGNGGFVYSGLNFGIAADSLLNALQPSISGSYPSCGTNANYTINVQNLGTTRPSGIIQLQIDTACTFIQSMPAPDSINGNQVYWSFDTCSFFQSEQIVLELILPNGSQEGNLLEQVVRVKVDSLDWSQAFTSTLVQQLDCASPTISKTASPVGIDTPGFIWPAPDYLDYTIHFQNTGSNLSHNLNITDQLDSNFVFSSLDVLSSSHAVNTTVNSQGLVHFQFNNINLPSGTTNPAQSMGYITYRVYLKNNRAPGTELHNSAVVMFDAKPELTTNTTLHTLFDVCEQWMLSSTIENRCLGEQWSNNVLTGPSDATYTWELNGNILSNAPTINWTANSAGVYSIHLSRQSQFCNLDTTFQITISPVYEVVLDTLYTCPGDSVLVLGSYRNSAGQYTMVLPTINQCDSTLYQTLLFYPEYLSDLGNLEFCQGDSVLCFGSYRHTAGTYYDTLQSVHGCDSILYHTITMRPVTETVLLDREICIGDSALIFGNYYTVPGTYSDTLSSTFGCDSIVKQTLLLRDNYLQDLGIQYVCPGDSLLIFNHYQSVPGIYYDSMQTVHGCDSIVSIELQLSPEYEEILAPISICAGDSVLVFGTYQSEGGSYQNHLQSVSGCDSVQIVNLILLPVHTTFLPELSVCSGDSLLVFGQYLNSSGTYSDTLSSVFGCDSIVVQTIHVNSVTLINEGEIPICEGESIYLYGANVSEAGVYYDTLQSIHGCDSIVYTTLSINPRPVVSINGWTDTMICMESGLLTLPVGQPANGIYSGSGLLNGNQFNAMSDTGVFVIYYVYTDASGCRDSAAISIDVQNCASVKDWKTPDLITIYPNPGWETYYINNLSKDEVITAAMLYDLSGRLVLNPDLERSGDQYVFRIRELPVGTYWLELRSADKVYRKQLVHQ